MQAAEKLSHLSARRPKRTKQPVRSAGSVSIEASPPHPISLRPCFVRIPDTLTKHPEPEITRPSYMCRALSVGNPSLPAPPSLPMRSIVHDSAEATCGS